MGVRLPAGPHLSDTSLLLGRNQSQLPREQLRLEPDTTRSLAQLEEQTTLLFVSFHLVRISSQSCSRVIVCCRGVQCVWTGVLGRVGNVAENVDSLNNPPPQRAKCRTFKCRFKMKAKQTGWIWSFAPFPRPDRYPVEFFDWCPNQKETETAS